MKIITINAHSLVEPECEAKRAELVKAIKETQPDIIAIQEANQAQDEKPVDFIDQDDKFINVSKKVLLKKDNYAYAVFNDLKSEGIEYYAVWYPLKTGYEKYDEGLAIFSKKPVLETENFVISNSTNYHNWKTRAALGVRNEDGWFYNTHLGWWNDEEELYINQVKNLNYHAKGKDKVWLIGDFNSDAFEMDEGYKSIVASGWHDSFMSAKKKDEGYTVTEQIDNWSNTVSKKMRIDFIFSNYEAEIASCETIFNGKNYKRISDHIGVIVEA